MTRGAARNTPSSSPKEEPRLHREHWPIFRQARGVFVYAEPGKTRRGEFQIYATSREDAKRVCRELALDALHPQPRREPGAYEHRAPARPATNGRHRPPRSTYSCGHPRTHENTYASGKTRKCRTCRLKYSHQRYDENRRKGRCS